MPFKSKRQLQTCFGKQISAEAKGKKWTWRCGEWLKMTDNPDCLPTVVGHRRPVTCRKIRQDEKIVSAVHRGSRGGYYFMAGGVKVYVPKGNSNVAYAKKKYGYVEDEK